MVFCSSCLKQHDKCRKCTVWHVQKLENYDYLIHTDISPKKCCCFLAIGLISVWKFSKKMLLFFGYWTYISMEIFRKNVVFFWLLDLYQYGKRRNVAFFWLLDLYQYGSFEKKCCYFLAIGLISVWKFSKKMLYFFGYWTYISLDLYQYGLGTLEFKYCKKLILGAPFSGPKIKVPCHFFENFC